MGAGLGEPPEDVEAALDDSEAGTRSRSPSPTRSDDGQRVAVGERVAVARRRLGVDVADRHAGAELEQRLHAEPRQHLEVPAERRRDARGPRVHDDVERDRAVPRVERLDRQPQRDGQAGRLGEGVRRRRRAGRRGARAPTRGASGLKRTTPSATVTTRGPSSGVSSTSAPPAASASSVASRGGGVRQRQHLRVGVLERRAGASALVDAGHHAGRPAAACARARCAHASAIVSSRPGSSSASRRTWRRAVRGDLVGAVVAGDGGIEVRHHAHPPAGPVRRGAGRAAEREHLGRGHAPRARRRTGRSARPATGSTSDVGRRPRGARALRAARADGDEVARVARRVRREDMPGRKRRARGSTHLGVRRRVPIAFGAVWIGRPTQRHGLHPSHHGGARRRVRRRRRARGLRGGLERALPRGAVGAGSPAARQPAGGSGPAWSSRRARSVRWA